MIQSFADKETKTFFETGVTRKFNRIAASALRKLVALDEAVRLVDLNLPPGNRLEALKGDRQGQHSIRINNQYRVCFKWEADGPHNVEIVDYH
ncbi:MAG: type II toxin-antitoxin system RelE/ParE family toxin [Acidobacteriaceae bacterium]|nr:type II toxin-antitoxin system RelE/ParE family toxin [Acidobacteriaceae bacterium]MBV9296986.1 type II toxin-antitoxin system RelE/ParE family toxin [Acidobacteriaceae bacterium]MBV9765604.1 type II toxin-antitoxin system RelE/ParE family toxin [Acidobacteriaceae bacterium]